MISRLAGSFKSFANNILGLDETKIPKDQFKMLDDLFRRQCFNTETDDLNHLMKVLREKHQVSSISVCRRDGKLIASTHADGYKESISGTSLLHYIQSEMPESNVILIRGQNAWYMILYSALKVYVVKSPSNLSPVELKAISKEVEAFIEKHKIQETNVDVVSEKYIETE